MGSKVNLSKLLSNCINKCSIIPLVCKEKLKIKSYSLIKLGSTDHYFLFGVVNLQFTYPDADMIYTDECEIGLNGERHSPYFKLDCSPDLILSHM